MEPRSAPTRRKIDRFGRLTVFLLEGTRWLRVGFVVAGCALGLLGGSVLANVGFVLFGIGAFWVFISWSQVRFYEQESRRTDFSHCPRCGYDREGLPTRVCPECGCDYAQWAAEADRKARSAQ